MTTPFEREILTHYWCGPEEFPRRNGVSFAETMNRFVELGLLFELPEPNEYGAVYAANHEALRPYMAALDAVPLPIRAWMLPPPEPKEGA